MRDRRPSLEHRRDTGPVDGTGIPGERAYRDRARLTREGLDIDRRIQDALIRLAEGKQWND
ncbi:MAG: hypothetical protein ACREM3_21490 [Candidatus Rokuibacteriota bacterium]